MIARDAAPRLAALARYDPVVTVVAPGRRRRGVASCGEGVAVRAGGQRPAFRIPGWHATLRKQVVKTAKLRLVDSGVACYLLGIREPEQLRTHPLRGAPFESWVAAELLKRRTHHGLRRELHHFRDPPGLEVDLVWSDPDRVTLIEVKSGATIAGDFTHHVERLAQRVRERAPERAMATRVIHGGSECQVRDETQLVPWHAVDRLAMRAPPTYSDMPLGSLHALMREPALPRCSTTITESLSAIQLTLSGALHE